MAREGNDDCRRREACLLVGKRVEFAHRRGFGYTVVSASNEGAAGGWMVSLAELPGLFAPHLFIVVKEG